MKKWFRWAVIALIGLLVLRQVALWLMGPWAYIIGECTYYPPPCPHITQPVPWWAKPFLNG
jgi:hypothetical protein